MAATSAVVTVPLLRAMTTGTGVSFRPWNGVASRAACRLGLLAGRRLLLFCWATLVSDGRNRLATTAAATQATTTAQRKRPAKRSVAAKDLSTPNLPISQAAPGVVPVVGDVVSGRAAEALLADVEPKPTP